MNHTPKPSSLESERKTTDANLNIKREKTNDVLSEARDKAERRTDKFVLKERNDADHTSSTSRIEADRTRDLERKDSAPDTTGDWKRSDDRMIIERQHSDRAVVLERSRADAAMLHERDSKSALMTQILGQDREQADENRLNERTQTDSATGRASKLLSDEIAEHSKTKVSLTTRDEFIAIVSHDLRNPIGAVFSCAAMLLDDPTYSHLTDDVKDCVHLIRRNADSALRLISDLLDMERVAEGKFELQMKPYSINEIMRECIENCNYSAAAKSVVLNVKFVQGPDQILCDHDRITQVILNLMGNAIKFTHVGGSVDLNASFSDSELQVFVADKGPGIPEEKQGQIFKRFAQLASKDRTGLGLGLYISKMLIESHHGRLWVESRVGEGSTFYFVLPRRELI